MTTNVHYEYWGPVKVQARTANEFFDQVWGRLSEDATGLQEYLKQLSTSGFDYQKLINFSLAEPDRNQLRLQASVKTDFGEIRLETNSPPGWLTFQFATFLLGNRRLRLSGAIFFPVDGFGHRGAPEITCHGNDEFVRDVCMAQTNFVSPHSLAAKLLEMLTELRISEQDLAIHPEAEGIDR